MTLEEVLIRDVEVTSLLIEKARRRSDWDTGEPLKYSASIADSIRDGEQAAEDSLWGKVGEVVFEHAFLRSELSEDEWERYDGPEYDFVLFPDSVVETTVDVKARVLARQRELDSVDPDERYPWYNDLLVRENGGSKADVYVQAIVASEYVHLSGWASRAEVLRAEQLTHLENDPYAVPQEELHALSVSALGGAS
jgi:hypothetical protein